MTKMDSYEASHGDIRQCGRPKRTDQRQTSWQMRNERQGNEPGDPESDQAGSVDQDQAGCATSVRGAVPVSVVL